MNNLEKRLGLGLFLLRISIFLVMFMWTIDKLIRPDHAAGVFANFYHIKDMGPIIMYVIGIAELVLIALFLLGLVKTFSYGAVLVLHAISTLSSYRQYFAPFEGPHLLFFAAWPMLAGCFVLFYLRNWDRWTLGKFKEG